jgi:aspartate dehydrogenase
VKRAHVAEARSLLPDRVRVVTTLSELLELAPTVAAECAGQGAVRAHAAEVLSAGTDLVVISTGALAEAGLLEELTSRAKRSGSRLIIPAGAIAGIDGLASLKLAGLSDVTYTSTKPPIAWRGTRAEEAVDLFALSEATVFFEGSAREAALSYPKNANLAATVALAGLGLDRTLVRLIADPRADGNTGTINAQSTVGSMRVVMTGAASDNPKTSASTAFSVLHALRSRYATLVI